MPIDFPAPFETEGWSPAGDTDPPRRAPKPEPWDGIPDGRTLAPSDPLYGVEPARKAPVAKKATARKATARKAVAKKATARKAAK